MIVHAGLMALRRGGLWRGALITGDSGSGKSDLALRLLQAGWRLVADDRTVVWASDGRLFGRAPRTLTGLIEIRQVGVLARPVLPMAEIVLVAACEDPAAPLERIPPALAEEVAGVRLPKVRLHGAHASAPVKLASSLCALDSVRGQA